MVDEIVLIHTINIVIFVLGIREIDKHLFVTSRVIARIDYTVSLF